MSLRLHGDTLAGPEMLDFAVNVWPKRPQRLEEALAEGLHAAGRYPDERGAREALARRHGRAPDEVLLLNGACEAFWLVAHAYRPRLAACVHPGFTEAEAALRAVGSEVAQVFREQERWSFRPEDVPAAADLVVVDNPNNPSGAIASADLVLQLAREGRLVVVDESFMDFVRDEAASVANAGDVVGLTVVRSLTKLWSLPGIRAGYLLAPRQVVAHLERMRQPWSVNSLACAALAACAEDEETPRRVAAEVAVAREELLSALGEIPGIRAWPSAANFLLLRTSNGPRLVDELARHGVATRPAGSFPGLDDGFVRIAVRTPDDNAVLVAALRELADA